MDSLQAIFSAARQVAAAALAAGLLSLPASEARADRFCDGADPASICGTRGGTYRVRAPAGAGPFPAVILLHAARQTSLELVEDPFFVQTVLGRDAALVVPDALPQRYADGSVLPGWNLRNVAGSQRDDAAFVALAIRDAVHRFNLDPSRLLLAGFGGGASLVWQIACAAPATASAFAPFTAGFYERLPDNCRGPFRMVYTFRHDNDYWPHAEPARKERRVASPVPATEHLALARRANGCRGTAPIEGGDRPLPPGATFVGSTGCRPGGDFALLTHQGNLTSDLFGRVLDWFTPAPPPRRAAPPGVGAVFMRADEGRGGIGKRPPGQ